MPGTPITSDPAGISVPSVTTAPTATIELAPIRRTILHDGPHADHDIVFDGGAVDDRQVADGHAITNDARKAGIGVHDRSILNVGAAADANRRAISPQHGVIPDAGLGRDRDITHDHGARAI